MYQFIQSQNVKNDAQRKQTKQFYALKDQVIAGQREQIEKLNNELDKVTKERDALHEDTHILTDKWMRDRNKLSRINREKTKSELELGVKNGVTATIR